MQDLIAQTIAVLSFISIIVLPFLAVLLNDIRNLLKKVEESYRDDGTIDVQEMQEILASAGIVLKRILSFWMRFKPKG